MRTNEQHEEEAIKARHERSRRTLSTSNDKMRTAKQTASKNTTKKNNATTETKSHEKKNSEGQQKEVAIIKRRSRQKHRQTKQTINE